MTLEELSWIFAALLVGAPLAVLVAMWMAWRR